MSPHQSFGCSDDANSSGRRWRRIFSINSMAILIPEIYRNPRVSRLQFHNFLIGSVVRLFFSFVIGRFEDWSVAIRNLPFEQPFPAVRKTDGVWK